MFDSLVLNKVDVVGLDQYASIIGLNPSQGARSPLLWNAVYKEIDKNIQMVPLDVDQDNLFPLLDALENDEKFIGSAVAVPYKEQIVKWLDGRLTPAAEKIGAVNCLYRQADDRLIGTNTDGEGALRSYNDKFGSLEGKKVLLLGTGGAAKAVAAYFYYQCGDEGELIIVGRNGNGKDFADRINSKWISWNDMTFYLSDIDVIVNCSTIGFGDQVELSPIDAKDFQLIKRKTNIFDIIYQPLETELAKIASKNGMAVLNGLPMNLEQAVIAFQYANPDVDDSTYIRRVMQNV